MRRSAAPSIRIDKTSSGSSNLNAQIMPNAARNTESLLSLLTGSNVAANDSSKIEDFKLKDSALECSSNETKISQESVAVNDENQNAEETKRIYNVVWGKPSTKKHKTWEGDGTLEIINRNVTLKDEDGKVLGRASNVKPELLEEGKHLIVGGKQVEILDLVSGNMKRPSQEVIPELPVKKIKQSKPIKASITSMSRPKSLFSTLDSNPLVMPAPSHEHQWRHNAEHAPVVDVRVDPCLNRVLRPHQRAGVVFLYECVMGFRDLSYYGGILADEMGLGKTLQCITLIWTLLKQGPYGGKPVLKKVLVVSPSSLVGNWYKEFLHWLGRQRIQIFTVDQKNKPKDFLNFPQIPVMLISYEMFVRCFDDIEKIPFDLLVCDEAHRLKNTTIKLSTLLSQLPLKRKILLTGTPIQNDLQELFSLVNFVNPGVLGSNTEFHRYFEEPIVSSRQPDTEEDVRFLGEERARELNRRTNWFILRRTQEINDQYLPTKYEYVVFCRATVLQRLLYEAAINYWECRDELPNGDSVPHLAVITAMKKICNHPALLKTSTANNTTDYVQGEENIVHHLSRVIENVSNLDSVEHSSKLNTVMVLLEQLRNTQEKVVIVSYFTQTLDLLSCHCERNGYKYCRLDGSTPVSQRIPLVDKFNSSYSDCFVFLLSARAGGVGLNLTGASRLVLYDSDWNPATDLQAMSRIWRDGQKKSVHIYRLLTTGTVEEKIFQRQISKTDLSGAVIDPNSTSTVKLSSEELKDLFTLHQESVICLTHDLLDCKCSGDGVVPKVEQDVQEMTERDCQIQTTSLIPTVQNLRMNQLYQWEHYSQPFNRDILHMMGLDGAVGFITFVFRNSK